MHTEVIKHKIKDGGEDGIWETAGMAICLGVVQNYTFQQQPSGKWGMIFNPKDNDDDSAMFGSATTPDEQAKVVQGLLLTKEVLATPPPSRHIHKCCSTTLIAARPPCEASATSSNSSTIQLTTPRLICVRCGRAS